MLYYFKKGKKAKKICAVYGEGAVTGQTCQKWFAKLMVLLTFWPNNPLLWGCFVHWKMVSSSLASAHKKPIAGDSWHTQNIQVNKVIGENEKCVFYFTERCYKLFGQPNTLALIQ